MIFNKKNIITLLISYLLGVISGYYYDNINIFFFIILVLIIILLNYIFKKKLLIFLIIILFLIGFFYMYYYESNYNSSFSIKSYNGQVVEIVGKLKLKLDDVEGNSIILDPIFANNNKVKYGKIQIRKDDLNNNVKNGDLVIARIALKKPKESRNPGGFSYLKYLKNKKIYSIGTIYEIYKIQDYFYIFKPIINLKIKMLNIIDQSISPPVNTFVKALILGEKSNMDDRWSKYFRKAGANHLLAISGLHVGFISLFIISILNLIKISDMKKNIILTIILFIYVIMTGIRASVLRASLLVIIYRFINLFEIEIDFYTIISIVLFIILLIDPYQLFSIGLKLSFLVLLSIVVWAKYFNKYMYSGLAVSLAAQIGSIPLTAYYFNTINPSGLITNLWAVPLVSLIVFLVLGHFCIAFIIPFLSEFTGSIIYHLSLILKKGVTLMSKLPSAEILVVKPALINVYLYYLFMFLLAYYLKRNKVNIKKQNLLKILLVLILATIIIVHVIGPTDNGLLEIFCLDVGQGDAIFIKSPDKKNILVDTGNINSVQNVIIPFLLNKKIRYIDYLIITHFDSDHSSNIKYLIKNNFIKNLIISKKVDINYIKKRKILRKAKEKGINIYWVDSKDNMSFNEILIDFISPLENKQFDKRNDNSVVFRLKYQKFEMLFTGDIESDAEKNILKHINEDKLKSDILKVSHHGSITSSKRMFINEVNPIHALISVGNNKYGHPSNKVIKRLKENNIKIWRTDHKGAIIIKTDGLNYSINSILN